MNSSKKPKTREQIKRILFVALPFFSSLFIISATALIIALISGYSFDISKRAVIKTGVLNVETSPTDADISVTGTYYGKTNRAIPNLKVGNYTVKITKEGYFPFTKKVTIRHGLATPVIVPLLRVDGQKVIRDLTDVLASDHNKTGFYLLSKAETVPTSTTATPTTTKTPPKQDSTATYLLTRISVTKPIFDDPKPTLDETMTITSLAATPITGISVSPTGKLFLVTVSDKTGQKSLALLPFKQGTTVNANLATSKTLTNYVRAEKTTLTWTENGDYLLIENLSQIISYNVRYGSRVILAEKSELADKNSPLIWSITSTGIVSIHKAPGTKTDTYEITDVSYNGNPLATLFPLLTLDSAPTSIWSYSTTEHSRYIVATKKGTYLLGALYDAKATEYLVTLSDKSLDTTPIAQLGDDFSSIKLSDTAISARPLLIESKHMIVFLEQNNLSLLQFTYNKRIADQAAKLGRTVLLQQDKPLKDPRSLINGSYIAVLSGDNLFAVDLEGDNLVPLQQSIQSYTLGQNDTGLLFTNDTKKLLFRILR